jgi:hypothetical protein
MVEESLTSVSERSEDRLDYGDRTYNEGINCRIKSVEADTPSMRMIHTICSAAPTTANDLVVHNRHLIF